jgi:hypothetical protein
MPIRLAQARLIPRDSYMPTHLRKSPCRSVPPLRQNETPDTLHMAGADSFIRKKMLKLQLSPRVI